ncbi:MAG: hypothetical protein ABIK52_06340, partial [Bacteroidota bacterium]
IKKSNDACCFHELVYDFLRFLGSGSVMVLVNLRKIFFGFAFLAGYRLRILILLEMCVLMLIVVLLKYLINN